MTKASTPTSRGAPQGRSLGRYLVFGEIASGGTATVHIGRRRGPAGTGQMVAIKRLHTHLATDPQFTSMLLAEARLTERVRHPNVVPLVEVLDAGGGELLLVMDYVHGETMGALLGIARRRGRAISPSICVAIMTDMLLGLHAAHEAESEEGSPLALVHGDVSPQNIIVGADGKARLLDFGIAKATSAPAPKPESPSGRRMMGTPAYMAPERWRDGSGDRRSDLFSAGVVFWEMLALDRLFRTEGDPQNPTRPMRTVPPPSKLNPAVPPALDAVVLRALQSRSEDRWGSALEFMKAAAEACAPAGVNEVSAWVSGLCGQRLRERAADLARIEAVASAEYVATEIADEEPTVVETDLAARLARMVERDAPPSLMTSAAPARLRRAPGMADGPMRPPTPPPAPASASGHPSHDILDDGATSCATMVRPSQRTIPLPLAAPLPMEALAAPRPALPGAPYRSPALVPRLEMVAPVAPAAHEVTFAPAPMRALGSDETDRYPRRGRRAQGDMVEGIGHPLARGRGRLLLILASLPSAALALVLLDRTRPAPTRAQAAAPVIAVERPAPTPAPAPPVPAAIPEISAPPAPVAEPESLPAADLVAPPAELPPAPRPTIAALPRPVPPAVAVVAAAATSPAPVPVPARARQRRHARPAAAADVEQSVPELHRRALQAYEDLDPDTALGLLQMALRRCQDGAGCGRQPRLLAVTHLYLGVVLAGGFRQSDLAAKHLRISRTLQPSLVPPAALVSPEVRAALRASGAGTARL